MTKVKPAWQRQATSKQPEPEPEKDDRDQGEDRCDHPGDHPKSIRAPAKRNASDVHAPNAGDQGCRQEDHREHREYVKVSVGLLLDLSPQLLEQKLTMLRILLGVLDQRRITMDLVVEAVEFVDRKLRRALVRQFEHGRALVGHIA